MNMTPAEARAIAKEAYIYGFPMVDSCPHDLWAVFPLQLSFAVTTTSERQ